VDNNINALAPTPVRTDRLAVVVAALFWGTGGLAGAVLAERSGIDALAVAGYRLLIGGGMITAWLALTGGLRTLRISAAGRRRIVVIGVLAAVFQSCYFAAVEVMSVSLATLVTLGSAPLLVVVAESVLGRKRPGGRMVAAVVVSVAGLTLLVGGPGAASAGNMVAGTAFAVASGGGFAAMTLLGARPVPGLPVVPMTGLAFGLGGLMVLPLSATLGEVAVDPQAANLGLLIYLGLVPTALAYTLYFSGLRGVATGVAALVALLEPLTAAVLGALVLGDRLGPVGIAGGALVGVAVVAVSVTEPGGGATPRRWPVSTRS
jgi:drug/metabolite transporter, DME family